MKSRNEVNTELQIMTWNGMNESIIVHICTHYHNKFTTHIYIERGNMLNHISWKIWIRQQVAELTTAPSAQLACNYHQGKHETCAQHRHETGRKSPGTALCQVLGFKKLQDQDSNHKAESNSTLVQGQICQMIQMSQKSTSWKWHLPWDTSKV